MPLRRILPNKILLSISGTILRHPFQDVSSVFLRYSSKSVPKPLRPVTEDDRRRIYIMGQNPRTRFIAHALASLPNPPPVIFLVFSSNALDIYQLAGCKLTMRYQAKNFEESVISGVGMEVVVGDDANLIGKGYIKSMKHQGVRLVTTLDPLDERDRKYLNNSPDRIESDVAGDDRENLSDESIQDPNYSKRIRRLLLSDAEIRH